MLCRCCLIRCLGCPGVLIDHLIPGGGGKVSSEISCGRRRGQCGGGGGGGGEWCPGGGGARRAIERELPLEGWRQGLGTRSIILPRRGSCEYETKFRLSFSLCLLRSLFLTTLPPSKTTVRRVRCHLARSLLASATLGSGDVGGRLLASIGRDFGSDVIR